MTSQLVRPSHPAHVVVLENPAGGILLTHITYHTLEAAGVDMATNNVVVKAVTKEEYMERVRREYGEVVDRGEMEVREWELRWREETVKQRVKEKQDMKSKCSHQEKKNREESRKEKLKEVMLAKLEKNKAAKNENDTAAKDEEIKAKEAEYDLEKVLLEIEGPNKEEKKTKKSRKKGGDPVLPGEEAIRDGQGGAKASRKERRGEVGKTRDKEGGKDRSKSDTRKNIEQEKEVDVTNNEEASDEAECERSNEVEEQVRGAKEEEQERGAGVEVEVGAPEAPTPCGVIPISSSTSRSLLGSRREAAVGGRGEAVAGSRRKAVVGGRGRGKQAVAPLRASYKVANTSKKEGTTSKESNKSLRGTKPPPQVASRAGRAASPLPSRMAIPGLAPSLVPAGRALGPRPGKARGLEDRRVVGVRMQRVEEKKAVEEANVDAATEEGREVEEALWRSEVTAQAEATRRARLRRQQEFLEFRHLQVGEGLRARVVWWLLHDVWTAEFC